VNRTSVKLLCGLAVVGVASCASPTVKEDVARRPESGGRVTATPASREAVGQHWVQSDRLRPLMGEISATAQRDWPTGLPPDPEDKPNGELPRAIESAAALASELADAATRIPQSVAGTPMSEADRAGFQAEADTLHRQALRLGQAAREKRVEQMQRSLDGLNATCVSCHSRYRDFSGQLDARRVAAQ
jgi:hypothetical protein